MKHGRWNCDGGSLNCLGETSDVVIVFDRTSHTLSDRRLRRSKAIPRNHVCGPSSLSCQSTWTVSTGTVHWQRSLPPTGSSLYAVYHCFPPSHPRRFLPVVHAAQRPSVRGGGRESIGCSRRLGCCIVISCCCVSLLLTRLNCRLAIGGP